MGFYKEFLLIVFEMCISIFVVVFGYAIWDNFDLNNYNVANTNDKIKFVEQLEENNVLYLHNVSKNENRIDLTFKVDKNQFNKKDNIILNFNNKEYNLESLSYVEDNDYYYFDIDSINFTSYETKEYNFNVINDDLLDYEFITI